MLALDTETNGLDFKHGAKPYIVITADESLEVEFFEWDVDQLTREPQIPEEDVAEIQVTLESEDLVLQNAKFDFHALASIGCDVKPAFEATQEILFASHLVASNQKKDLTTAALVYLGINLKPLEDAVEKAVKECRRHAKSHYPDWKIAKKGLKEMPSAGETVWKLDMWLPRAIAQEENLPDDHPYWTVTSEYASGDVISTVQLWPVLKEKLEEIGCWEIYLERLKLLPIIYEMEEHGIAVNKQRLLSLQESYLAESDQLSETCLSIAAGRGYELELPKASANNSLKEFCFGEQWLDLPCVKSTKKGEPSLDKEAKATYEATLEGEELEFIKALNTRGKRATSLGYIESYQKFMLPIGRSKQWFRLYSSLNPTGTDTLRMSSSNPNQQQISKQVDENGRNLRYAFGPAPGREWWALDYDNLELRIPAYECQEPAMLDLFEYPDKPPFYGSYHLLIVSILHPEEWDACIKEVGEEEAGELFKKKYKSTLYQWTKNGNFAELYGAVDRNDGQMGTADRAFHKKGAQSIISKRLKEKNKLNKSYIAFAEKNGFVYTLPDRTVNPEHGYPLQCSRTRWGQVLPTVPLNYHVQGTACWVMMRAMFKVRDYLQTLRGEPLIVMNVHDEIVLDFPFREKKRNLPKIRKVRQLMESCGDDVGVKLTCGMDYHPSNWAEAV